MSVFQNKDTGERQEIQMNRPDFTRLKSCMRRAEAGEELTIGFSEALLLRTAWLQSMRIVMHTECFGGGKKPSRKLCSAM